MKFGIYRLEGILAGDDIDDLERLFNRRIEVLSFYRAWNRCHIEDDLPWLTQLAAAPRQVLLTWEPWSIAEGVNGVGQPAFSLAQLLSGRYDGYIRAFARAVAGLLPGAYLRPMHEMNGCWYPWCGTVNGNTPGEYLQAWMHLRQLFAEEGATDLTWVWSPYAVSYPTEPWNSLESYFPGEDQVDLLALDGYNWGDDKEDGKWESFEALFAPAYDALTRLSGHGVMIAETASSERGGAKDAWIREALAALTQRFNRVEALVWFDVDKECDWRIASSAASLAAFREAAGGGLPVVGVEKCR